VRSGVRSVRLPARDEDIVIFWFSLAERNAEPPTLAAGARVATPAPRATTALRLTPADTARLAMDMLRRAVMMTFKPLGARGKATPGVARRRLKRNGGAAAEKRRRWT